MLLAEKVQDVARPPNRSLSIQVDRRSRMFNPFDLDFQPMPLDDPASYRYMQCVDGRRGYPMWEGAGITNAAESPDWWQFLPLDDDGVLVMDAENAVRIALLHSPDYQRQLEALYLSALAVSTQRFQFDTQFFGGLGTSLTADGPRRTGQSSTRAAFGDNSFRMSRAFATGGELVANIANSVVWELSGPNTQSANTIIDFTLLQPLLRTAGRDVVLEQLTQAERDLLAQVRSFERFRRSFFLRITTGRGLELQSSGIVQINAGSIGGAGGYLGLLQQQLRIRNQEENIVRQTENLLLTENNLIELLLKIPDDASTIVTERLQVAQARSRLLNSQTSLVNQQTNYQRQLDTFMRDLGLPPYICAKLNDPILDQFELIDRALLDRREELSLVRSNVGEINVAILELSMTETDPESGLPEERTSWTPELKALLEDLQEEFKPLADFNRKLLESDLNLVTKDIDAFEESLPRRQRQSKDLEELYNTERNSICALLGVQTIDASIFDLEELETLDEDLRTNYSELQNRLQLYQGRIEGLNAAVEEMIRSGASNTDPAKLADKLSTDIILRSQDLLADLGDDVLAIQLIQARARTESVLLPDVDIDPEAAFEIARKNRRDWANARAALVDAWRDIEVTADDLESDLDVVFSGDVLNVGNNPFNLRSTTGRLRVGLQWDAPITRVLERNAYRSTLITYEQTRRRYYSFEDDIWQLLRSEIRQLRANQYNFELGRQAVRIAAAQIELTTDIRSLNEARGRANGNTAARDAIDALNDLLNAQNGLLDVFVSYEVVRRGLDLDLGTMELTPDGLWLDPGVISPDGLLGLPGTTIDGLIECGCNDCGLRYNPLPPEPVFMDVMQPAMQVEQAEEEPSVMYSEMPELLPSPTADEAPPEKPITQRKPVVRLPSTAPSDKPMPTAVQTLPDPGVESLPTPEVESLPAPDVESLPIRLPPQSEPEPGPLPRRLPPPSEHPVLQL